jgi:SAM-dependent methyltransferase
MRRRPAYNARMTTDAYLDPYRASSQEHGTNFGVTLWASEKSQRVRFDVFAQMCFLPGKRLLDAGCSRGDLAAHLIEQGIDFAHYTGIDALPNVIEHAQSRRFDRCTFVAGDFVADPKLLRTGDPQVVLISGSLNTMADAHVFATLEAAWAAAGETLLFNFLSDKCGPDAVPQDDFARRLNTVQLLEWAASKTSQFAYRQDYFPHGHDGTVMMRKG